MPCYDKKLEASRQDFYNEIYSTRDVDCVITTGELDLMMKEKGFDIAQPIPGELLETSTSSATQSESGVICLPDLIQHPGSSSGSYLQAIIEHVKESSAVPLAFASKQMRNADYEEVTLTDETTGRVVFKGAKCYGFRNLQNVVRKVGRDKGVRVGGGAAGKLAGRAVGRRIAKKGATTGGGATGEGNRQYDYVEVMACPGGCVNGGGQLKPIISAATQADSNANGNTDEEGFSRNWEESGVMQSSAKWGDKDWTRKVEEAYWSGPATSGRGDEQEEAGSRKQPAIEMCSEGGLGDRDGRDGIGQQNHSELQAALLKPDQGGSKATVDALNGPHDPLGIDISEGQVTGGGGGGRGGDGDDVDDDLDEGNRAKTVKKSLDDSIGGPEPGTWPKQQARRRFGLVQSLADRILEEMVQKEGKGKQSRQWFLRTQYHAVESEVIGLAVKW
jgi:Iron only hydrogenase large subunit, C-terminal domain